MKGGSRRFTIGDAELLSALDGEMLPLANRRFMASDAAILNQIDLVDEAGLLRTRDWVRGLSPHIRLLDIEHDHVPAELIFDRQSACTNDTQPFVLQKELGDSYITYELNFFTDTDGSSTLKTYSDLHDNILDVFNEFGVQIMSPHDEADRGEKAWVPKERWYGAPAGSNKPNQKGAAHDSKPDELAVGDRNRDSALHHIRTGPGSTAEQ